MNKTKLKNIWFLLLIISLLISSCNITTATITIDTNTFYNVENQNYTVNDTTRTFNQITIDDNYIVFNNTGFNVTCENNTIIYIDYLNSSITSAGIGDLVLEFCAETSGGNITFNIDGFRTFYYYIVKMNNTQIANVSSRSNGMINFSNTVWSKKSFQIYQSSPVANLTPVFSNPNPGNGSVGVDISTGAWNITIVDPEGDTFNWTIETSPDIGSNSSNSDINGSKTVDILGNLSYSNSYIVYVNATDTGSGLWTREWFTFTTDVNNTPVISDIYPNNNSRNIVVSPVCYIVISDAEGDPLNISFYEYTNSTWTLSQTNNSVGNGTYYWNYVNASVYNTRYYWNVSVFDGYNYNNNTYNFRTEEITSDAGGGSDDEEPEKPEEPVATNLMHPGFILLILIAIIVTILIISFIIIKKE